MTNASYLDYFFSLSISSGLFREAQLMIHDFWTLLSLSPSIKIYDTDIWRILVFLLLGFWSYFGCKEWIHQDRQAPWSFLSSPSPFLLTNPKLLSMVSSWPWRGGSPGRGEALTWLQAPTRTTSKSIAQPPFYSPLLHCPNPTPSVFV